MVGRKKKILALLLKEDRVYSYEELSSFFNISNRLVRYDINELNMILVDSGFKEVKKIRGKGICLDITEKERSIANEMFLKKRGEHYTNKDEREVIIIFSIANINSFWLAQDFQKFFQVSKSTIDADMRVIREECRSFNITIASTHKKALVFKGDECKIRLMLNNIVNTRIDVLSLVKASSSMYLTRKENIIIDYLGENVLKSIFNTIKKSIEISGIADNELYFAQLTIYFAIWKIRYTNGCRIDPKDSFISKYERRHSQQIVETFFEEFNIKDVEESEKKYLYWMVDSLNLQKKQTFSKDWVKYQLISVQLINKMEEIRGIEYDRESDLFGNLLQHITGIIKRVTEHIEVYNPVKNMVKKEYSDMFEDVKTACKIFESEFDKALSDEEIAYLCMYFYAAEEKVRELMQFKYRVIVVCAHGIATGKVLVERLKRKYQFNVIGLLSSYEVHAISKLEADFVLKTTEIEIDYLPSLLINPIPKHDDYEKIKNFIEQNGGFKQKHDIKITEEDLLEEIVTLVKSTSLKLKENIFRENLKQLLEKHEIETKRKGVFQPMISELLLDRDIKLKVKATDWKDAITKATEPLIADKVIEPRYVDAMVESVIKYGPYIVIGKNIALAHARSEDGVNKLGISVITLDPPVPFNHEENDPVSIVFCLAAIDNTSHLKMMSTLVRLINEDGKIEELSKQETIDDFKKVLFELENK